MKNYRGVTALLLFVLMAWMLPSHAKPTKTLRFEADTVRVLRNPLNGWVMYLNRNWDGDFWEKAGYDAMKTSDGSVVKVSDYASTAYLRTSWASLEPEEGHYAWRDKNSRIWRLFKALRDRDMRIALRIVVDGRNQGQNTPMYVIDAGRRVLLFGQGRPQVALSRRSRLSGEIRQIHHGAGRGFQRSGPCGLHRRLRIG